MAVSDSVATKRLTEYADCAGCASKIGAAELTEFMHDLPAQTDPRVLVDYRTADDAGVYRWSKGSALVQTVDFFTPIVDDPYIFGQIAAANALSDVYAMGGVPRTALAIAALPKSGPGPDVIRDIFRGGSDMLRQASVALLGGHTVSDPEIKFGYAITGEVDPDRMLTNAGARPDDVLLLTKPLGTGVIVRARKYGSGSDEELDGAVRSMQQLNDRPAQIAAALPPGMVSACTDVTGFGLVGHANEMAVASGVTMVIETALLPVLPGALRLVAEFLPCGGRANLKFFKSLHVSPDVDTERHLLCLDPQTSGGLLMSVHPEAAAHVLGRLADAGVPAATIGRVETRDGEGPCVRLE
jgi:selenide,water dikinase